jgi:signal transduction histidine kinase
MRDTGRPSSDIHAGGAGLAFGAFATRPDDPRDHTEPDPAAALQAQLAACTRALADAEKRLQAETAARQQAESALREAQKLQAAGQLTGGIAHDFNNTLATILGNLELIERCLYPPDAGAPADDARLRRLIDRAMEAVQRGARLTSLLNAFARRQGAGARETDVKQVIGDLLALGSGTLGRNVRVRTDVADDLWPVRPEPGQVAAALLNLVLNARDAMPRGGELAIAAANASLSAPAQDGLAPGDYVRVVVADTGCGMAPDVLARACEPFFTTKGLPGAGHGLVQVQGLARHTGGAVSLASTPGQGTEVVLMLPRAPAPAPDGSMPRRK